MKSLKKRNDIAMNTVEAFSCTCYCYCSCGCASGGAASGYSSPQNREGLSGMASVIGSGN